VYRKKSGVLLAQPRQRRQNQRPSGAEMSHSVRYLRESMLCCRSPEKVLAAIVISDQRMLEAEPVGDGANARSFEILARRILR